MIIQDFSDPRIIGAACAAANQITAMSNSIYKSVVVIIMNGTFQVCGVHILILLYMPCLCRLSMDLSLTY